MTSELEQAWEAQEPSASFVDRVVEAAVHQEARPRRRRYGVLGAVVAAAAAAAVIFMVTRPSPVHGELRADRRIEVAIGSRAVAVLEPGAHVRWNGDVVEQDVGDVFYRVEPGSTFTVRTPRAETAVLGTCFRINVMQEDAMKRRDVVTGAAGVIAGAAVVIGVYEGKVRVSRADQSITVGAGETAIADGRGVRAGGPPVVTTARGDNSAGARTAANLREQLATLEQEKAALEQELIAANDQVGKSAYDLSPEDWATLAANGQFKYQFPCFHEGGFRPSDQQLARMGLRAQDGEAIQAAYRRANERFQASMAPICSELAGGQPTDEDMVGCIPQLFRMLYAQPGGAKTTFTQVGEIRAGMRAEPPSQGMTPQMKMLLVFSGSMAPFEADLANTFGVDEAHRIAYSDELCFQAQSL
ncbi:MAG: hypothetical protein AB7P03_16850 [Kofleriaceae bacterium]